MDSRPAGRRQEGRAIGMKAQQIAQANDETGLVIFGDALPSLGDPRRLR